MLADLCCAVRDPHRPRVSAIDGAASLRVALAAQQSARTGQAVELGEGDADARRPL